MTATTDLRPETFGGFPGCNRCGQRTPDLATGNPDPTGRLLWLCGGCYHALAEQLRTRTALIDLAELAIDNPNIDAEILDTPVTTLTPGCASTTHRAQFWTELKAAVAQYDLGDLTAEGPDHWAARRDEALNELLGVRP